MREKRYLIDSNIIIYHLNNESIASNFLLENIHYSAISRLTFIKVKKIKLPDNIIASTAQINDLTLVTRNEKDFKNLNIDILNLFEDYK